MSTYLSIVVPLYNDEESVENLLGKILEVGEQFEFAYEIILVDDGSTDRTWDIIDDLKKTNPELKAIKFSRNYGQTNAMVAGFDHSSDKFVLSTVLKPLLFCYHLKKI